MADRMTNHDPARHPRELSYVRRLKVLLAASRRGWSHETDPIRRQRERLIVPAEGGGFASLVDVPHLGERALPAPTPEGFDASSPFDPDFQIARHERGLAEGWEDDGMGGRVPILDHDEQMAVELEREHMLTGHPADLRLGRAGFAPLPDPPSAGEPDDPYGGQAGPDDTPESFSRLQRMRARMRQWPVIGFKRGGSEPPE